MTKYLSENLQVGLIGAKTDEKYASLDTDITNISNQLKALFEQENSLNDTLADLKRKRKSKFDTLFERVDRELKTFYFKLTETSNKIGGNVILYVENKEEPFEAGIIYTPNPPNKKYIFDNTE